MKAFDWLLNDWRGAPAGEVAFVTTVYVVVAAMFVVFLGIVVIVTHGVAALVGLALYALYRFIKRQVVKARADAEPR